MLMRAGFAFALGALFAASSAWAQDAITLKERARAFAKQGDYVQAIKAFDAAVAAATREYGAADQRTDIVVNELAIAHYNQGNYSQVEPLYLRVLKNTEARPGHELGEVATCLNNLGALYDEMGDYDRAEETYMRSLRLRESEVGRTHPDLATTYSNLATVARNKGDSARAIDLFKYGLFLYEQQDPRDDALVASALNGLAEAHESLGQAELAEPMYLRSLKLREAKLGADHPSLATTLNNLAGLYKRQKQFAKAEVLYQRSLTIRREKLGPDHPSMATALGNLASLYRDQGKYKQAEELTLQALAIREAKLGKEHPSVAISLNNLAGVAMDLDQAASAEDYYQRSLKIRQARNGSDHPDVAQTFNNLGYFHARQKQPKKAAEDFDQSRRVVRKHVAQILPALSEADQLTFLKVTDEAFLHGALSLALEQKQDQSIVDLSAGWILNSKGIAQQSVAQRMMLSLDLTDPEIGPLVKSLQDIRRELSRLSTSTKGDEATRLARIKKLREQEQQVAANVATRSGRPVQNSHWIELAEVRRSIPSQSVLIEIARFRLRDFAARHADPNKWQPAHYAAWIIPAADEGVVRLIDLGPADTIEERVKDAREALVKAVEVIRSEGEPDAEQQLLVPLAKVADVAFKPILSQVGTADTLILSPDASLWLMPWSALPLDDKTYAVEKYVITYVVSGRDVIRHAVEPKLTAPVILADPDYDLGAKEVVAATKTLRSGQLQTRAASRIRPLVELPAAARLPATATEAQAITPKLESYTGKTPERHLAADALEAVAKSVRQPQVLVLSTHGFFVDDEVASNDDSEASGRRGKAPDNPLLRCGLLLAGCNTRQLATIPDADDGILTGLEVAGIDLRGTELVVLSACETGLGDVRNGEGVAGLRQAFQLAGARSVMSTLWQVPDVQTARLMSEFFTELASGRSPSESLRQAQLSMIAARRKRTEAAHPFFWAAVTLTGLP
jgi:CHAT domain-containing protein/Tfp pilus assembly protein PilF